MGVGSRSLAATRGVGPPPSSTPWCRWPVDNLVAVPGGVLIRDDNDAVIGALGVSGHLPDDDEACAIHAITDCDLRADPGRG